MTQGACAGYPFSGWEQGHLTGQVTKPANVATGAAKSEPHEPSPAPVPGYCTGAGVADHVASAGCTRGAGWCQGGARVRALYRVGRVHIRAVARPG